MSERDTGSGEAGELGESLLPWRLEPTATRRFPKRVWIGLASVSASFAMLISGISGPAGATDDSDEISAQVAASTFTVAMAQRTDSASRAAERVALEARAAAVTTAVVPNAPAANNARMETRTEIDEYERIEQENPNRYRDLGPRTIQAGQTGQVTRVYRYVEHDGVAVGTPILEIVAAQRQDHIVEIGTRARPVAPVAPPAPAGGYGGYGAPGGHGYRVDGGIPESVWVALAQCESGGRPSVISAGGRFHGLYQFSVATWRSVGGEGLPSQATPYEQRYRAVRLQARSGWGQWPACSRRIGVR